MRSEFRYKLTKEEGSFAYLVAIVGQVGEQSSVNGLHGGVLEAGLRKLGLGEFEHAGEVQRLHGGLLALLGEVVGAQHVQVEGQHRDEGALKKGLWREILIHYNRVSKSSQR
jgi:hypothetical protein